MSRLYFVGPRCSTLELLTAPVYRLLSSKELQSGFKAESSLNIGAQLDGNVETPSGRSGAVMENKQFVDLGKPRGVSGSDSTELEVMSPLSPVLPWDVSSVCCVGARQSERFF